MTVTERIGGMIVVRFSPPGPHCTQEGETVNRVSLAWMKKYASSKPLFRPKTWKQRQEEAKDQSPPADPQPPTETQ